MKIAINGFGRIGRAAFKIAWEDPEVEVVAINDLGDLENLAYLLQYDSAYGVWSKKVKAEGDQKLVIDGTEVQASSEKNPADLPWGDLEVDLVIDSTGVFKDREGLSGHLEAGAPKVILSAPTKDESIKTIVLGVNDRELQSDDRIISMASCTTNCIAPMMKVLGDNFGVEKSLMSTIHSYTSTQAIIDGMGKKGDFRRGRAAALNIIPATTGAAVATTLAIPELKGNFDGMAFRVPTPVGSISDIVVVTEKETNTEEVNQAFTRAAQGDLKGILKATDEALVSQDIVGDSHSVVTQLDLTKVIGGNLIKVVGWYDNEWGYSNRLIDVAKKMGASNF